MLNNTTAWIAILALIGALLAPVGEARASGWELRQAIDEALVGAGLEEGIELLTEVELRFWGDEEGARVLATWEARSERAARAMGAEFFWVSVDVDAGEAVVGDRRHDLPEAPGPELMDGPVDLHGLFAELDEQAWMETAMASASACTVSCYDLRAASLGAQVAGDAARGGALLTITEATGAAGLLLALKVFVLSKAQSVSAVTITTTYLSSVPPGWLILGTVVVGGVIYYYVTRSEEVGEDAWVSNPANGCPGCGADPYAGWQVNQSGDFCFDPDCSDFGGNDDGDTSNDPASPPAGGQTPEPPAPGFTATDDTLKGGTNPGGADLGAGTSDLCESVDDCTSYSLGDPAFCQEGDTVDQIECNREGQCVYWCSSSLAPPAP